MPSKLARVLADLFPDLATDPSPAPDCWASRALRSHRSELAILSDAIVALDRQGQLEVLKRRIRREHPSRRAHRDEYDAGLLDCLTEACAFAWTEMRRIGRPALTATTPGAPDIRVDADGWLDAKAIHPSATDQEQSERMRRTGEVVTGTVTYPGPGFLGKFQTAYANALTKFARVGGARHIVFFNLTSIDMDSWPHEGAVLEDVRRWANAREQENSSVRIVVCYRYDWRHPVRDPFQTSESAESPTGDL